jgi:hypothetical protein
VRPEGITAVRLELPEGAWLDRERVVPVEDGRVRIPAGQPGFVRLHPRRADAPRDDAGPVGDAGDDHEGQAIDVAIGPHGRQASELRVSSALTLPAPDESQADAPDRPFDLPPVATFDERPPWTLLLALALVLAIGEWLLHHRRVTT